ncbi:MAG: aminotransferase class III-fold pyridoxal phosphate-dependent enzyme [Thermoanaerobaculia bacterium]
MTLARGDLAPAIAVAPPGPASRALARRLASSEAPGINTVGPDGEAAIAWSEALGANVLDVDGNLYVDLTSGFGAAAVGHRHPQVVAAVAEQAARLVHGLGDVHPHPPRVALAERLVALAPVDDPTVHFAISGADAVEIAIETALLATGNATLLAFDPAYHGTTLGALAASSRAEFRRPFAAHLSPRVIRAPFAAPIGEIERHLAGSPAPGAVLVEPIVGREGTILPPDGWLAELARWARRRGALLIADEIFTGFARTGRRFAVDHDGVRPDLVCCGKALGGGLPIAALVGRRELLARWATSGEALHTATFVAHPLACAAALASLAVLEGEDLAGRARRLETEVGERLAPLAARGAVRAVRGRGLLWGIELVDRAAARALVARCLARGVLVLSGGPRGDVVQIAPPLVIDARQLAEALEIVVAEARDVGA